MARDIAGELGVHANKLDDVQAELRRVLVRQRTLATKGTALMRRARQEILDGRKVLQRARAHNMLLESMLRDAKK